MSRFVDVTASDEIVLANGERVQVRQRLTAEEDAALTRNLMRLKFDTSKGEAQVEEGEWHLQRVRIAEAYLLDWDFKEDGKAVPFSRENIRRLDSDSINEIATAVDALQAKRKEESQKNGLTS